MKPEIESQTTTIEELRALLERVRQQQLGVGDLQLVERLIVLVINLYELLEKKRVTLKQIRARFFINKERDSQEASEKESKEQPDGEQKAEVEKKPRAPGHGRNSAEAYRGAKVVYCENDQLQAGAPCPDKQCQGHLYEVKRPAKFIRLEGQPLIGATHYQQQILKCSRCEMQCIAKLPTGVPPEKYAPSADAAIVLAKYDSGIPFNRLARLQSRFGVPLPASVQWERVESVANILLPVFFLLQVLAAMAAVLYQDDTSVRILKCQPSKADKRKGIRTTGMVADCDDYKIVLYASGRNHAGDNANELLAKRPKQLPAVIKMSDALKLNLSETGNAIITLCLVHGRRKFTDIQKLFPEECHYVIDKISKIYDNEEKTKAMTPHERLEYHQKHSTPILAQLREWISDEQKRVEPNSALGDALQYFVNHWHGLTQFTRIEKAPLDNNIVEQALRTVVLHRNNSLFFRNDYGAVVADILMSVVASSRINGIEPFDYLLAVIKNQAAVRAAPAEWLPWVWQRSPEPTVGVLAGLTLARCAAPQAQLTMRQSSGKEARTGFP